MALLLGLGQDDLADNRPPSSLAWGDFDADGLLDVYVSAPNGSDRLLRNLGGGSFEPVELPEVDGAASLFAMWHDVDRDGDLDLFVAAVGGTGRILANLGSGFFEPVEDALPEVRGVGRIRSASWLDFDQDGAADLQIGGTGGNALLRNDGQGRFALVDVELGGTAGTIPARASEGWGPGPVLPSSDHGTPGDARPTMTAPAAPPPDGRGAGASVATIRGTDRAGDVTGRAVAPPGAPPLSPGTLGGVATLSAGAPCAKTIEDQSGGSCLGASTVPTAGKLYPLSTDLFVSSASGFVGLGLMNPLARLHVGGDVLANGDLQVNQSVRLGPGFFTGLQSTKTAELDILAGGANRIHIGGTGRVGIGTTVPNAELHVAGVVESSEVRSSYGTNVNPAFRFGPGLERTGLCSFASEELSLLTNGTERILIQADGKVGINELFPSGILDVSGGLTGVGGATVRARNIGTGIAIFAESNGTDGTMVLTQKGSGSILRGFNGGGSPVFEVRNSGRCKTTALEVTGGGDLVEGFDSGAHEADPGTVMCIDPEKPGSLRTAERAYDRRVAGVVSGANGVNHGIRMGQDDVLDGDTLVAMSGRVYVRCTTQNGAIAPGDLLTTSDLAGHAMKASDPERSFGAVIGKAMTPLDASTGLVLVLVSLQ